MFILVPGHSRLKPEKIRAWLGFTLILGINGAGIILGGETSSIAGSPLTRSYDKESPAI